MVKELCFRCHRPVYPTDKVGPLKDSTFFHQGCFKCYICGTRLALRSYCHNRRRTDDREVYCANHAPMDNPHDPSPHRSNLLGGAGGDGVAVSIDVGADNAALIGDMRIQHALKATEIQKPYPKIVHTGAKYIVDYDQQTRLELIHRQEEDDLYRKFSKQRQEEEQRLSSETKEEWERALKEFAAKYDRNTRRNGTLSPTSKNQAETELIRQLTVKRDKRKETMRTTLREKERAMTADLVEKQSVEMMDLFRVARQKVKEECRQNDFKTVGNGHHFRNSNSESNGYSRRTPDDDGQQSPGSSYPCTPPPPFPPTSSWKQVCLETVLVETVDKVAVNVAHSEVNSFTDLIRALIAPCKNDVEKARAIYRWITVKNLNLMEFEHDVDSDTPMGLLRGIKHGTESYHVLFKRLCSYAGLHCVVIKGFSKSAGYQPGVSFEDARFRNTWNAVFADAAWRFVQCNWGARHLVNGAGAAAGAADLRYEYDDHYFFPEPAEFVYEFWPLQPQWQLLPRPLSLDDFERLPFVRSVFFRYGLRFSGRAPPAVVETDDSGAATLAVSVQSAEVASKLIFHYNLKVFDEQKQQADDQVNLKRFVMQSTLGDAVIFRVHAPSRGDFLLDIFANRLNTTDEYLSGKPMKFKSVCKFKIVCPHLSVVMVPLPECASGEWGPAKAKKLFGLTPVTHRDAIINSGAELEIRFVVSRPLAEFVASLRKNGVDERKLSKLVQHRFDRASSSVSFQVHFVEKGQYGLDLYTRESTSGADATLLTHCCKYLINVSM